MPHSEQEPLYPNNHRFGALCVALEIEPRDEGTKDFYERLHQKVAALLDTRCELIESGLHVTKLQNKGPAWSLGKELEGGRKKGVMTEHTAVPAVYRLLGFVNQGGGWTQVPRALRSLPAAALHREAVSVVPSRVRQRLLELWEKAPNVLLDYAQQAVAFLKKEQADPLPTPPWNEPYEFESGHEFIWGFLDRMQHAKSDVIVAAVSSHITASIARQLFVTLLGRGVRVRFLVFDFIHGDAEQVARMIRRSKDALYVSACDTIDALLWLREKAVAAGRSHLLEVRLLDRDPKGRWYLIDPLNRGGGYVVTRAAGEEGRATNPPGARLVQADDFAKCLHVVDQLWSCALPIDDWLPAYDAWRSEPHHQAVLGLR